MTPHGPPEWLPNHPRHEGAVLAFFLAAITGFACLALYAWTGALFG